MKKRLSAKQRLCIALTALFGIALTGGLVLAYEGVYQTLWYPLVSWKAPYMMTYEPFSGKLFDLEEIKIAKASVSVITGYHIDDDGTKVSDSYHSEVDAKALAELLNGFRYYAWRIHPSWSEMVPGGNLSPVPLRGGIHLSGRGEISMGYANDRIRIRFCRYPRGDASGGGRSKSCTIEYFCAPWEIAKLDNFCREVCGIGPED